MKSIALTFIVLFSGIASCQSMDIPSFDAVSEQVIDIGLIVVDQNIDVELWQNQQLSNQTQTSIETISNVIEAPLWEDVLAQFKKPVPVIVE